MTTAARRRWIDTRVVPRSITARPLTASEQQPVALWVVGCTALLPTVSTSAWLIAGSLQPPSYSPIRQTVSVLSGHGGTHRWIVTAALYVVGAAYLVTAAEMRALTCAARIGLAVAGVAAVGVASFPEPAQGTSDIHAVFTGIGAIAIAVWPVIADRQGCVRAAVGRRASIPAMLVSLTLLVWMAVQTQDGTALGLAERTSSAAQACWPFVVAVALRRRAAAPLTRSLTRAPCEPEAPSRAGPELPDEALRSLDHVFPARHRLGAREPTPHGENVITH